MDIGPIQSIRPVGAVRPSRLEPDLAGVFAVEFRRQERDDSYAASRKASRGLENETQEDDPSATESDEENDGKSDWFA